MREGYGFLKKKGHSSKETKKLFIKDDERGREREREHAAQVLKENCRNPGLQETEPPHKCFFFWIRRLKGHDFSTSESHRFC